MTKVEVRTGARVQMSEAFKARVMNDCTPGAHKGPFDPEDPSDCWGCGLAHVEEFGDCVGTVQGPMFDSPDAPEVDVVWEPSGLRYGYHPDDLVNVSPSGRYAAQCAEWQQIAQELTQRDGMTVAFDVSEEQRRRMAARGESEVMHDELLAELADHGA